MVKEKSFDFGKYNFTYNKISKDNKRKCLDRENGNNTYFFKHSL